MKGSILPYFMKLSVQGEGFSVSWKGCTVINYYFFFFTGSCTHLVFKQFITKCPKGIVHGIWYHFEIHVMKLELELYLSLANVEWKCGI